MNFELFIARRIFRGTAGQRFSRPAILIAAAGIAVGLTVMVVSVAVARGFKREVSGKVVGFGSDIQILSLTQNQNFQVYPVVTDDSLLRTVRSTPGVSHVQPFATKSGMLKTGTDFSGVQFKGVGEDYDLSFIRSFLVEGEIPRFTSQSASGCLLISRRVARQLGLRVRQKVFAYFFNDGTVRARRFTIAGIYETHLAEYDKAVCFTDIYTIRRLNKWKGDESTGLEIKVRDARQTDAVAEQLVRKVNHKPDRIGAMRGAFSIRDIAPHIFAWLDVLDLNVVMILILMMLIGSFTVVSGLLIVMLEHVQPMGLLMALGASHSQIRGIFRRFGVMLLGGALLAGDVLAIVLCHLQQSFHLVKLDADTYYIDAVPIDFSWPLLLLINAGVLVISSLVIFGSTFLMGLQAPARVIRWE